MSQTREAARGVEGCARATSTALVEAAAAQAPDDIAASGPGRPPLAYRRLLRHVTETIGTLNALGIDRRDRVAVVLPNGPEMATAFLAGAAGATCAPLDPAYRARE